MRSFVAVLGFVLLAGCSGAMTKNDSILNGSISNDPIPNGHPEYERQVALVKNLSKEADFAALRLAYTDTSYYNPYAVKDFKPMFNAMIGENFEKCNQLALRHLESEFVSLTANYAAMVCHGKLGKEDVSNYHRFILNGLMESIAESGNGRSTDTAFITISNDELYSFIQLSGLEVKGQSLVRKDGRVFDLMEIMNPKTEKEISLYFDVTIQMTKGHEASSGSR